MDKNYRILIVEDDREIAEILRLFLAKEGMEVDLADNGKVGLEHFRENKPSLIIADIMMPVMDGYEMVREIRAESDIPVVILSARSQEEDKIFGLDVGADAYITKPFGPGEVIAQVKALLRRYYRMESKGDLQREARLVVGPFELDLTEMKLLKQGVNLNLTSTELKIMAMFLKEPHKVFTKQQVVESFSDHYIYQDEQTVLVHIHHLRNKIEDHPDSPKHLITVRGLGYRFEV